MTGTTACMRWAKRMTERIPVQQTAPEDRCISCWMGTPWERRVLTDEDVRQAQKCPACGAGLGEPCLDLNGEPTNVGVHFRRRDLAEYP